jgi:hypothetical protein
MELGEISNKKKFIFSLNLESVEFSVAGRGTSSNGGGVRLNVMERYCLENNKVYKIIVQDKEIGYCHVFNNNVVFTNLNETSSYSSPSAFLRVELYNGLKNRGIHALNNSCFIVTTKLVNEKLFENIAPINNDDDDEIND